MATPMDTTPSPPQFSRIWTNCAGCGKVGPIEQMATHRCPKPPPCAICDDNFVGSCDMMVTGGGVADKRHSIKAAHVCPRQPK